MISDQEIERIIAVEETDAIGYSGSDSAIQKNRAMFLDYYNQLPYGDETEGMSSIVTSDVYDTTEGMLPPLMRFFTQGRNVGEFKAMRAESSQEMQQIAMAKQQIQILEQQGIQYQGMVPKTYEEQANEKTAYSNFIWDQNDGVAVLYNMLKDGLLQYTGWVKVYQDESKCTKAESYSGLSEIELFALQEKKDLKISEVRQDEKTGLYSVRAEYTELVKTQKIENIPPEETLISKRSRSFKDPHFIGQRTPKTRSQLVQMGFDRDIVERLGRDEHDDSFVTTARNHNTGDTSALREHNGDRSQDQLYLGEYYMRVDTDGDGVSELWQFFYCESTLLRKTRVDRHPYAVFVPIPIPHRAIGTCPAEHIAPLQYWRSTLVRQMNNNVYATNYNRVLCNDTVNIDDLLNLQPGGIVRVEGGQPVGNAVQPLVVQNQVPAVLEAIQYADQQREQTSGVTAYNQGMDTESLNKTATGFQGIRDMSMMRIEVIARHAAETIKDIFEMIIENAQRYQDEKTQIRVFGEAMEVDPTSWRDSNWCSVDAGIGSGDRQEKIANLNFILQQQKEFLQLGVGLSDLPRLYNTLDKLCVETGLKDALPYFVNPEIPQEQLAAENFQLKQQLQQLQAQLENPLAEAERAKGEMQLMQQQQKQQHEMNMKMAEMEQKDKFHEDELMFDLTKLEVDSQSNIPGSAV